LWHSEKSDCGVSGALPRRAICKVNCRSNLARVRGEPTAALLKECHEKVLLLVRDVEKGRVLYDTLEMEPPSVDVPLAQQELDRELGSTRLRRAIVVPNSRLAYLARLAFGDGEYRVFYNDIVSAVKWLADQPATS
jgi:hypothetical protein